MAVIRAVGMFISAVLLRLVTDDLKAWTFRMTRRLIKSAVTILPPDKRERYEEEWHSHVNDVPGELGKLFACFGLLLAARKMAATLNDRGERITVYDITRRAGDVAAAAFILMFFIPGLAVVPLLMRMTGSGPIFKSEEMIGQQGRTFSMIKFSTEGKVGWLATFLKHSRLEMIPYFINVMRGDMSIIGPKPYPQRMHDLASLREPRWGGRGAIRPGIVSWADVNGHRTWREELDHDLFYVEHRGLKLDRIAIWHWVKDALFVSTELGNDV